MKAPARLRIGDDPATVLPLRARATSLANALASDRMTTAQSVEMLVDRVPSFRHVFDEHLKDNDELLPHVLMGDITREISQLHEAAMAGSRSAAHALSTAFELLEEAVVSPDEEVQELVVVSFLENLDRNAATFRGLRDRLGPSLLAALQLQDRDLGYSE